MNIEPAKQGTVDLPAASATRKRGLIGFVSAHPLAVEFLLIFALFFIRFLVYGVKYYHQSGDYELFHNFPSFFTLRETTLTKFIGSAGMLAARPLTMLSSVFLWAKMYGKMIVVLFVFSLMYSASAVILRNVFNKMFGTGYFFTAIFCLIPAALDGVYVLNRAAAIVPAIFFASLAVLCMYRVRTEGKLVYIPLFTLAHLAVFFFDERIALLASVIAVVTALIGRNKYSLAALMILANICLYALYLQLGRLLWETGVSTQYALPFAKGYLSSTLAPIVREGSGSLSALLPYEIIRAFIRGLKNVFTEGKYIYLIAVAALCALCFLLLRGKGDEKAASKDAIRTSILALVFVLVPIIPSLFLKNSGLTIAEAVPSICGIALLGDTILRAASRGKRFICVPVITVFAFVCCIGAVSEMHDYRLVSDFDSQSAESVVQLLNDSYTEDEIGTLSNVGIINIKVVPKDSLASRGGQTVSSALDSADSFTELLKAKSGNGRFPTVTPIPVDEEGYFYRNSEGEGVRVENFEYIFVATDYAMIRVIPARGFTVDDYNPRANYENFLLYTTDFTRLAHVSEYSTHGIFKFY